MPPAFRFVTHLRNIVLESPYDPMKTAEADERQHSETP